jgi:Peptidyl-tRNA hydrolase PTH2
MALTEFPVDDICLYLLMRTDLNSLNPGKACAQAHHAGTQLANRMRGSLLKPLLRDWYVTWTNQAEEYGTVLCLGCNEAQMKHYLEEARIRGLLFGCVIDPTYPIQDGQVTHLLPLTTCGYIMAPKSEASFLDRLYLMP